MGCGGSKGAASSGTFVCTYPACGATFATGSQLQQHSTLHGGGGGGGVGGGGAPGGGYGANAPAPVGGYGGAPGQPGQGGGMPLYNQQQQAGGGGGGGGGYGGPAGGYGGGASPAGGYGGGFGGGPAPPPQQQQQQQHAQSVGFMPPAASNGNAVGFVPPAAQPQVAPIGVEGARPEHQVDIVELQLEGELGRGAYGVVYEGRYRGREVAIKLLDVKGGPSNNDYQTMLEEFQAEAAFMVKLPLHVNVVALIGVTPPPNFWIVTEMLHKGSLYGLLHGSEPIDDTKMIRMVRGIASGMAHLHAHNVIHRDLAARNILLDRSYIAKISDFGLSRLADPDEENKTKSDVGPIKWMSPEAIKKKVYSDKSDVWSFGVTVWEVITRKNPYPSMDLIEVATAVCYKGLKPTTPDNCPPVLRGVLASCFHRAPDDRPSMAQIVTMLPNC